MAVIDAIHWLRLTDDDVVRLRTAVGEVLALHPEVIAAYHYGSSARRQPARDIDIGLVVDRGAIHSVDVDSITDRIAVACGRSIVEFDVRVVNDGDPVFLGYLLREGKRCFERDPVARREFELLATRLWLDFQPAWERMRRRVLEVWSRG